MPVIRIVIPSLLLKYVRNADACIFLALILLTLVSWKGTAQRQMTILQMGFPMEEKRSSYSVMILSRIRYSS